MARFQFAVRGRDHHLKLEERWARMELFMIKQKGHTFFSYEAFNMYLGLIWPMVVCYIDHSAIPVHIRPQQYGAP